MKTECVNFLELRICGVMRSGNHAIIDWIIAQHADQPVCFLNNVLHGHCDPYMHCRQMVLRGINTPIDIEALRDLNKRLLIYSYEDREELESVKFDFLQSALPPGLERQQRQYLKRSRHFFNILIIRDPFNCLASRFKLLQTRGRLGGVKNPGLIVHSWKVTAKAALSLQSYPEHGQLLISYNRWLDDLEYRKQLSQTLFGVFSDASRGIISNFGGGSSFSQADCAGDAKALSVLTRWQQMQEDKTFLQAIADPEVLMLSEKLFGEIPGTRALVKSAISRY